MIKENRNILITTTLIYCALGCVLLPFFRYQINPDGISYISIAQKYLIGDIHNTINGHWSPLFSWLLVPFLFVGIDPLLATKLLNLFLGVITFVAVLKCTYCFQMSEEIRATILFALIPVVLYFAFYLITPDLLVSCLMLFYLSLVFNSCYSKKSSYGILCGFLGGIAYLAKSYSLPFFLVHFPLMNTIYYLKSNSSRGKRIIIRNFLTGMIPFVIICGLWVGAISSKYGYLTVSTQTKHNLQFINPEKRPVPNFIRPPNETAVSIWEDPYSVKSPGSWTPFESFAAFELWMKFFIKNIVPTLKIFLGFSPLVCILCTLYVISLLRRPKQLLFQDEIICPLVTALLYATGYCLVLVDERYIWITCLLLMIMGGYVLNQLFKSAFFTKNRRKVLLVLFVVSFALLPVQNLGQHVNTGKKIHLLSRKLSEYIPPGSNLASKSNWYVSLFIAYHLKSRIYGTSGGLSAKDLQRELDTYAIDYFLVWGKRPRNIAFLSRYTKIRDKALGSLTVYRLRSED